MNQPVVIERYLSPLRLVCHSHQAHRMTVIVKVCDCRESDDNNKRKIVSETLSFYTTRIHDRSIYTDLRQFINDNSQVFLSLWNDSYDIPSVNPICRGLDIILTVKKKNNNKKLSQAPYLSRDLKYNHFFRVGAHVLV